MEFSKQRSLWALFLIIGVATAHGGHENVPEGEAVSLDPIVCRSLPVYLAWAIGLFKKCE